MPENRCEAERDNDRDLLTAIVPESEASNPQYTALQNAMPRFASTPHGAIAAILGDPR